MAGCSPCNIWTCFPIMASVTFWNVCGTNWWLWTPSPDHHWSYQRIMFSTASPVTCDQWNSSFICEDNRAALLFVSHLKRVNPSSWSLSLNWLRCRFLEEVMILWTPVLFVGFAAAGQVNSDSSSLEDNRDSSRASLPHSVSNPPRRSKWPPTMS